MNIYYFKPYDPRGLGYAYNSHCRLVPNDDDWICLMDIDTMFFSSQRIGDQLQEVVRDFYPKFSAFTCVASRAFPESQQQVPAVREETNLLELKRCADWCAQNRRGKVELLETSLNGHMMFFPKKLWNEFPFVTKSTAAKLHPGHTILGIDTDWKNRIVAAGHKIGCIYGLMAVHFYRLDDKHELVRHLTRTEKEGHATPPYDPFKKSPLPEHKPGFMIGR